MIDHSPRRVFVFGGTGMMGQRIVAMLRDSIAPERVIPVSRHGDLRVDITNPEKLPVGPGDVVIDAVGPYFHDPTAIVRHCLSNGAHYVDLTESFEFHDQTACALAEHQRTRAVTSSIVQGCSTTPAMVDVLVPDRIDSTRTILLSVGSRNRISANLLYGLLQPLGQPHADGRWWHETTTRVLRSGDKRRYGSFPSPNRGNRTRFYCGLDYRIGYWLLLALSPITRRMSKTRLLATCEAILPVVRLGRAFGTPKGSLRVERYEADKLKELIEIRAAERGLMIPALPAVWAALALLQRDDVAGFIPLSELIDRPSIIADLSRRGYTVEQVNFDDVSRD